MKEHIKNLHETECATCAAKPGTPQLCPSCLSNRSKIALLKWHLERAERALLAAGFEDLGGKEWKPPVNKAAADLRIEKAARTKYQGLAYSIARLFDYSDDGKSICTVDEIIPRIRAWKEKYFRALDVISELQSSVNGYKALVREVSRRLSEIEKKFDEKLLEEKKTSEAWYRVHDKVQILDPDGWDRRNFDFSWYVEKITEREFLNRRLMSTCQWPAEMLRNPTTMVEKSEKR